MTTTPFVPLTPDELLSELRAAITYTPLKALLHGFGITPDREGSRLFETAVQIVVDDYITHGTTIADIIAIRHGSLNRQAEAIALEVTDEVLRGYRADDAEQVAQLYVSLCGWTQEVPNTGGSIASLQWAACRQTLVEVVRRFVWGTSVESQYYRDLADDIRAHGYTP